MTAVMTSPATSRNELDLARTRTLGFLRAAVDIYAGRSTDFDTVNDTLHTLATSIDGTALRVDDALSSARAAYERAAANPARRELQGTLVSEAAALYDLFDARPDDRGRWC